MSSEQLFQECFTGKPALSPCCFFPNCVPKSLVFWNDIFTLQARVIALCLAAGWCARV